MVIEYIFIDNYKDILINKDINFGSEYIYSYLGNGKINMEKNKNYLKCIYDEYDVIENVTAIVGKNGVGKTTILRLINEIFSNKSELKFIIVYKENEKRYLYSNLEENIDLSNLNIRVISKRKSNFIQDGGMPTNIIYFSSVFDKNRRLSYNKYLIDISTNEMIKRLEIDKILLNKNEGYENIITEFRRKEIPNVLLFLNHIKNEKNYDNNLTFLFETPESIELRIENNIEIYKYNINKIRANDFHKFEFFDDYSNIINSLYGLFAKRFKASYNVQFFLDFLLQIPITFFVNSDEKYGISFVGEIDSLILRFKQINRQIVNESNKCGKMDESIDLIEKPIDNYLKQIMRKLFNKSQTIKNEYSYDNELYLDDDLRKLNTLVMNLTNILEKIKSKFDTMKEDEKINELINSDILSEIYFYMKEINFLIEQMNYGNDEYVDYDESDIDYNNELLKDDNDIKHGFFYDEMMFLNDKISIGNIEYYSLVELLEDIKEKTKDIYDMYLNDIFKNNKHREEKLKELKKVNELYNQVVEYCKLIALMKDIINDNTVRSNYFKEGLDGKTSINIKLDNPNFIKLLGTYSKLNLNRDILSYDWHNLSSGQNAYLDMISRIYMIKRNELLKDSLKNIILLIDEGDLYLHPSAQVQFLNNLLELINRIFNDKKIHIIITTNSPFIISDIKNDNVIYVASNKGQVIIEKNKNTILTFGANVNELLIDTFYMDMGTKGTFSTRKINSIKELLQMDEDEFINIITKRNIKMDDIKILIDSIGEEIVRSRLLELYWKKKSLLQSESDILIDKLYKEFYNLDNSRKRKFLERIVTSLK